MARRLTYSSFQTRWKGRCTENGLEGVLQLSCPPRAGIHVWFAHGAERGGDPEG